MHFNWYFNVLPHFYSAFSVVFWENPHSIKIKFIAIFGIYDRILCKNGLAQQQKQQKKNMHRIEQEVSNGKMFQVKKKQIEKRFTLQICCP